MGEYSCSSRMTMVLDDRGPDVVPPQDDRGGAEIRNMLGRRAFALWGVLELKIRSEERFLSETYPDYFAYRRVFRKRIPFVY